MNDQFLLFSDLASELYHQCAASLPIIDYHNHLPVEDLAGNRPYENISQLWITCDPYKHRAMRMAGVPEHLITGNASDREKYDTWVTTLPKLIGNPLAHWTKLELVRIFSFEEDLTLQTADRLWKIPIPSVKEILDKFKVESLMPCRTIDESLEPFDSWRSSGIVPSLRDNGSDPEKTLLFLDSFHQQGCRMADHSLDSDWQFRSDDPLITLGKEYRNRGWTLQLHLGARRRTSDRLRTVAGPAGGYASIGSPFPINDLCDLLNTMEKTGGLPSIILYNLNPADNAAMACLTGSFSEDGIKGKIQFGPAWWYNDHYYGIRNHLDNIASYGLLSSFVGMTTDSRSLLSLVRHEYFRRILCNWLAEKVQCGLIDDNIHLLKDLVRDVCILNIRKRIQ